LDRLNSQPTNGFGPAAVSKNGGICGVDAAKAGGGGGGRHMTEPVPVPSSEHVAEIVGRQGIHFLLGFNVFLEKNVKKCLK
jgi:hypothetical protein